MIRRSSISISFSDLQKWVKKQHDYALQRKSSSIGRGITNQEALAHDVACAETLSRMLEKCSPGRQVNLFEIYQEVKK